MKIQGNPRKGAFARIKAIVRFLLRNGNENWVEYMLVLGLIVFASSSVALTIGARIDSAYRQISTTFDSYMP